MTQSDILRAFQTLPSKQRLALAKKIHQQMADELFDDLDKSLPDIEISEKEIMKEVKAVRNDKQKN